MKIYRVQMVMSYWNTIEVEAEDKEEAGGIAFDLFDICKAHQGEGQVMEIELTGETE